MSRNKSTKPTGAELRARRDERLAGSPGQEAQQHEASFLANLSRAQADFEWIAERQAWTLLGHDSLADWWGMRVQPVLQALAMRPSPEMARRVIEIIKAQEAELPPSQRRSNKQLQALVGASDWTSRGRVEDRPARRSAAVTDLEGEFTETRDAAPPSTSVTAPETEPRAGTPDGSDGGTGGAVHAAAGSSTQSQERTEDEDTPAGHPAPADPARGSSPRSGQLGPDAASDVVPDAVPPATTGVSVAGGEPTGDAPRIASPVGHPETPDALLVAGVPDPDADREPLGGAAYSAEGAGETFTDWAHDFIDVVGRRLDAEDAAGVHEDLKDALRNALADITEHFNDVEVVWLAESTA